MYNCKMINNIQTTNINSKTVYNYQSYYNGKLYNRQCYDEDMLCKDDIESGMYRSVISSVPENKLLAFAPPKTLTFTKFRSLNISLNDIVIHEYIDGRMLHVFYDSRTSSWTLSPVITNDELNIPDIDESAFIIAAGGDVYKSFNNLAFLEFFPKNYSYTFIIKKQPLFQASLYLITVYKISDCNQVEYIPQQEYENWRVFSGLTGVICFPKQCIIKDYYTDLLEDIDYDYSSSKWVLTNSKTGRQTTISTTIYKLNQEFVSIDRVIIFQYLCLQRIYKDKEQELYNLHKKNKSFYTVKQLYDLLIRTMHEIYIKYYIMKTMVELPIQYKSYITQIHEDCYIYPRKHNKKQLVTKPILKEYFDKKHPLELLTILSCNN
jgi:hypothetical protein